MTSSSPTDQQPQREGEPQRLLLFLFGLFFLPAGLRAWLLGDGVRESQSDNNGRSISSKDRDNVRCCAVSSSFRRVISYSSCSTSYQRYHCDLCGFDIGDSLSSARRHEASNWHFRNLQVPETFQSLYNSPENFQKTCRVWRCHVCDCQVPLGMDYECGKKVFNMHVSGRRHRKRADRMRPELSHRIVEILAIGCSERGIPRELVERIAATAVGIPASK